MSCGIVLVALVVLAVGATMPDELLYRQQAYAISMTVGVTLSNVGSLLVEPVEQFLLHSYAHLKL